MTVKMAELTVDDALDAVLEHFDLLCVHLKCTVECEAVCVWSFHRLLASKLDCGAFLIY